jgi:5-methylcytosine-specific restriction endonuclease McrA
VPPSSKICPVCKANKPSSEYYKNSKAKDGITYQCKECAKAHVAKQRALLPKSVQKQRSSASYQRHKEKRLETSRQYRANNRQAVSAMTLRWKHANKARVTASEEKRRARKKSAESTGVTPDQWAEILEQFNHCCAFCLEPGTSMDHFRPLARGGTHSVENVVPACGSCNASKHDDLIFDWLPRFERRAKEQTRKVAA